MGVNLESDVGCDREVTNYPVEENTGSGRAVARSEPSLFRLNPAKQQPAAFSHPADPAPGRWPACCG